MPSLALLRFCAYDEQNKLIGHRVIPLTEIRSGYRYICLKSESYQPANLCMIFVKINVQNYVAEDFKSNFVDNFLYIYIYMVSI
jgi:phosphatidylinositol phospholipase C beta